MSGEAKSSCVGGSVAHRRRRAAGEGPGHWSGAWGGETGELPLGPYTDTPPPICLSVPPPFIHALSDSILEYCVCCHYTVLGRSGPLILTSLYGIYLSPDKVRPQYDQIKPNKIYGLDAPWSKYNLLQGCTQCHMKQVHVASWMTMHFLQNGYSFTEFEG